MPKGHGIAVTLKGAWGLGLEHPLHTLTAQPTARHAHRTWFSEI
jgi:hypothetical protein